MEISRFKDERIKKKEEDQEVQEALKHAQTMRTVSGTGFDEMSDDEILSDSESAQSVRGRGRGRGSKQVRGKGSRSSVNSDINDDRPARGRGGRGGQRGREKNPVLKARSLKDMLSTSTSVNQRPQHRSDTSLSTRCVIVIYH